LGGIKPGTALPVLLVAPVDVVLVADPVFVEPPLGEPPGGEPPPPVEVTPPGGSESRWSYSAVPFGAAGVPLGSLVR
jgi:hypothetical protein